MPSSPITDSVAQPGRGGQLLDLLATVPDPRDPRGVRYRLSGMLAVAVTAVLAGARSFTAIGEWAADLSSQQLCGLGLGGAGGVNPAQAVRTPGRGRAGSGARGMAVDPHPCR